MLRKWWVIPVFLVFVLLIAAVLSPALVPLPHCPPSTQCLNNLKVWCRHAMYQDVWDGKFPPRRSVRLSHV